MNQNICLQINYKQDSNGNIIFDNYKIVDNTGSTVQSIASNASAYDTPKKFNYFY